MGLGAVSGASKLGRMDEAEKRRLLDACAAAQREYEEAVRAVELPKVCRREAFAAALHTPITAREIVEITGLSGSVITRLSKGQR